MKKPEIYLPGDPVEFGRMNVTMFVKSTNYVEDPPCIYVVEDLTSDEVPIPIGLGGLKHTLNWTTIITGSTELRGTEDQAKASQAKPIKFTSRRGAYETALNLSKLGLHVLVVRNTEPRVIEAIAAFRKIYPRNIPYEG